MKKILSFALVLTMVGSFAACTPAPKPEAPKADAPKTEAPKADAPKADAPKADAPKADAAEKQKTVGIVMPNATHGFMGESIKHAEASAKEYAAQYGMGYKFLTSSEASEQNNQIDSLINEKVDCVVLWPHNGDELRSAAQKVVDAKIPLIIYDRLIPGFTPTAEIMGDNVTIGEMTGKYFSKYFAEDLAKGEVAVLEFKGDNSTVPQQRSDGFAKTADKNIKVVQQFSTDWQRQKAMEQMETFLTTSSKADVEKIKGIFTHDDEVALGILDAVQNYKGEAKLNIKLISGVGGRAENLDTFAPIKEKFNIDQVTYEFSPAMDRIAVEDGFKILKGENITGQILIPTTEVDNSNEKQFREKDTFKIRYSLK